MTVPPNHNRLDGVNYTFRLPVATDTAGEPTTETLEATVSIHRDEGGAPIEVVCLAPPTKTGHALFVIFREFGIQLSRALQHRDPVTGAPLPESERPAVAPSMRAITDAVAEQFGLFRAEIVGDRRSRRFARPRQVAMWLCSRCTPYSLPRIALYLNRDHKTVMYGIAKVDELRAAHPGFRAKTDALLARFDKTFGAAPATQAPAIEAPAGEKPTHTDGGGP